MMKILNFIKIRGVLQCMGNEYQNFKPPENKFLEVNNIKKNLEFYLDGKRYFNLKREKDVKTLKNVLIQFNKK